MSACASPPSSNPVTREKNSLRNWTLKALLQAKSTSIWLKKKPVVWSWKP